MNLQTHFLLVRHGETEANINHKLAGWLQTDLTELGRKQATALGKELTAERIDRAFSSDLKRAADTAELCLAGRPDVPLEQTPDLREWGLGELEGHDIPSLLFPGSEIVAQWEDQNLDLAFPGGESRFQLRARVFGFLKRCAQKHPGERILIVTHGAALQQILISVAGTPPAGCRTSLPGNTSLSRILCDHTLRCWRLISWNDTHHLRGVGEHSTF